VTKTAWMQQRRLTAPRVTGRRQNVNYLQMYYGTSELQNSRGLLTEVAVFAA